MHNNVLTEWEGRMGKFLFRPSAVRSVLHDQGPNIFLSRPDQIRSQAFFHKMTTTKFYFQLESGSSNPSKIRLFLFSSKFLQQNRATRLVMDRLISTCQALHIAFSVVFYGIGCTVPYGSYYKLVIFCKEQSTHPRG